MRGFLFLVFLTITSRLFCNMAYMGPAPGNVAGRNTSGNIRVKYEEITVDMRGLPNGRIRVFADYRLESKEAVGEMVFLFVASGQNPVNPEIILDGQVMSLAKVMLPYFNNSRGDVHWIPRDSWPEAIGMELESELYFRQPIEDSLWVFRLPISPGMHRLKIGYEVTATAFDKGNLRYYAFPYYLGNKFTRPLYDSIVLKALLPGDISYTSNATLYRENEYLVCKNLQRLKSGHFYLAIYKDAERDIATGYFYMQAANIVLWMLIVFLTLTLFRRWKDKQRKLGKIYILGLFVGIGVSGFYYFTISNYYSYFQNKYGLFLKGSFDLGYGILLLPIIALLAIAIWYALVFLYLRVLYNTKWDLTRLWMNKRS